MTILWIALAFVVGAFIGAALMFWWLSTVDLNSKRHNRR